MGRIYLITEGAYNKLQVIFWNKINEYLYNSMLNIIPSNGVKNIRSEFKKLKVNLSEDDVVLINMDVPEYNTNVLNEKIKILNEIIKKEKNTYLIEEICFEDTLLRFKYLRQWLYSVEYRKNGYLSSNNKFLLDEYLAVGTQWRMSVKLCNLLKDVLDINDVSTEKVASYILSTLTYYKCKLQVTKDTLGNCWYCNCNTKQDCYFYYKDNIGQYHLKEHILEGNKCGLYQNKKDTVQKIKQLYRYIPLYNKMQAAKVELLKRGYTVANIL